VSLLSRKCGSLDLSQPYGPPRPVTGIALPLLFAFHSAAISNDKPYNSHSKRVAALFKLIFSGIIYHKFVVEVLGQQYQVRTTYTLRSSNRHHYLSLSQVISVYRINIQKQISRM
jgi:hypothetical protein